MEVMNRGLAAQAAMMALVASVLTLPGAGRAQQTTASVSVTSTEAFGVLARLAGTVWGENAEIAFEWAMPGEILSRPAIQENGIIQNLEIRRSLDGRSLIVRAADSGQTWPMALPSKDSFEVRSESGEFMTGCRLAGNGQMLMCEQSDGKGGRTPYQLPRSNVKARQAALASASEKSSALKMTADAEFSALASQYGSLAPFLSEIGSDGKFKLATGILVGTQTVGRHNRGRYQVAFQWNQDPKTGSTFLRETWLDDESGSSDVWVPKYSWVPAKNTSDGFLRTGGIDTNRKFATRPDGTMVGKGRLRNENYLTTRWIAYVSAGDKLIVRLYSGSDEAMREAPLEEYILSRGTLADYNQSLAKYQARIAAREQAKRSGGGDSGLFGAFALGTSAALAGGNVDQVMGAAMKGAEMTTSSEGARMMLAGEGDAMMRRGAIEAQNQTAYSTAPSTNTDRIGSTAGTSQSAQSTGYQSAQSGFGRGRLGQSSEPVAARKPVPTYFFVGMMPTESRPNNPMCYSTLFNVEIDWDERGVGNAGRHADAAKRYEAAFIEKCSRLGTVTPSKRPSAQGEGITSGFPRTSPRSEDYVVPIP